MKNKHLLKYWIMIMVATTSFITTDIQAQSIENATTISTAKEL